MGPIQLRAASIHDATAINEIYNHYVLNSTCTYQEQPETQDRRVAWLSRREPGHPVYVATLENQIVGWGSLSSFHGRSAFRFTVEDAIYVHPNYLGKGIGRQLLATLVDDASRAGHHCIVALIDSTQPASLKLHQGFGFVESGRLKEVGLKFGRWLDLVYLQKLLEPASV